MQRGAKKIHEEAHLHIEFGPSTDVGGAQADPGTDHAKAVSQAAPPRCGPTRGAATPLLLPPRPDFLRRLHATMHSRSKEVS